MGILRHTWPRRHEIALRSRHIRLLGIHARVSTDVVPGGYSPWEHGANFAINQTRRSHDGYGSVGATENFRPSDRKIVCRRDGVLIGKQIREDFLCLISNITGGILYFRKNKKRIASKSDTI